MSKSNERVATHTDGTPRVIPSGRQGVSARRSLVAFDLYHLRVAGLTLLLLLCSMVPAFADFRDRAQEIDPPEVVWGEEGLQIKWRNAAQNRTREPNWIGWQRIQVDGSMLPAHLFAFIVSDPQGYQVRVDRIESHVWTPVGVGPAWIETSARSQVGQADLSFSPAVDLPSEPIVEIRRARAGAQEIVVLALLPLTARNNIVHEVADLQVALTGLVPFEPDSRLPPRLRRDLVARQSIVPPPDPRTEHLAVAVRVRAAGLQEIPIQSLIQAGLLDQPDEIGRVHLWQDDTQVAVEAPSGLDGVLRFYAPTPGDRWNNSDLYWVSVEEGPGLRIRQRPALTSTEGVSPPSASSAWELGTWYEPHRYVSKRPGPDGDHWYAADLRTGPDLPANQSVVPLLTRLPPLSSPGTYTVTGTAYTGGDHHLVLRDGTGQEVAAWQWQGDGDWSQAASLPGDLAQVSISLIPDDGPTGLQIDRLTWQRPVSLTFSAGGAFFVTHGPLTRYRLAGLRPGSVLYDVTDPARPVRIGPGTQGEGTVLLLDSQGYRRYLLADRMQPAAFLPLIAAEGTLEEGNSNMDGKRAARARIPIHHQPALEVRTPVVWQPALDADVLYIAPARFHAALDPLVTARSDAGHQVAVVDVQAIYDGWSDGQVSPKAIRSFLRYARTVGERAPLAVTLVGDGTRDPLNYTGLQNENLIPPYLAMVDPWLGETACDTCYAQLDGENPLDDPLPDLYLGRIPAKTEAELARYVEKVLDYEQRGLARDTQSRAVFVADNFRNADGSQDGAGDFAYVADRVAALQPAGFTVDRIYYDPSPSHTQAPWREPDAESAFEKTFAALDTGAAFVTYVGHAHQWQWASTDLNADPPYLMGLYDVDRLTNRDSLPILLEMTCLTGAFHEPAIRGTTIDERFLLQDGGAVAVWAPTGFGVAYGHDLLQEGFFEAYWEQGLKDRSLGVLIQAGYLKLFTHGTCCQEVLRTYTLLGDPLTEPQAVADYRELLPRIGH